MTIPSPRSLLVRSLLGLALVATLVPAMARPALADVQVCSWTGGGSHTDSSYPWTDAANWDAGCAGTPGTGADVTIGTSTATTITDVPTISLDQLTITNDGSTALTLQPASSSETITITHLFNWRSGTIGAGLTIELAGGSGGYMIGEKDTGDRAVLEGALSVLSNAKFWVVLSGYQQPIGQSDAVFRVGPHSGANGTVTVHDGGRFYVYDGAVAASDDANDPGWFVIDGALGDDGSYQSAGARVMDLTISFSSSSSLGSGGLLDLRDDELTFGASSALDPIEIDAVANVGVRFGGTTDATMTGATLRLSGELQLGDPGTGQTATLHGGTIIPTTLYPGHGVWWCGAKLTGAPMEIDAQLTMSSCFVGGTAPHVLDADLTVGSDSIGGQLAGALVIHPGVTLTLEGTTTLWPPTGDPATSISGGGTFRNEGSVGLAGPGLTVPLDGITFQNDGTVALDTNLLELDAGTTFAMGSTGKLTTILTGPTAGSGYGAIAPIPATTGQTVSLDGTFSATASYSPALGQRFGVISVPGGSITGSFATTQLPTTPTKAWTVSSSPSSYALVYSKPKADLNLSGGGPDSAVKGKTFTDTFTVKNMGPSKAIGLTVTLTLPVGVKLVSATIVRGSCHGTKTVTCTLPSLAKSGTAKVVLKLQGSTLGRKVVSGTAASNVFDPKHGNDRDTVATTVKGG